MPTGIQDLHQTPHNLLGSNYSSCLWATAQIPGLLQNTQWLSQYHSSTVYLGSFCLQYQQVREWDHSVSLQGSLVCYPGAPTKSGNHHLYLGLYSTPNSPNITNQWAPLTWNHWYRCSKQNPTESILLLVEEKNTHKLPFQEKRNWMWVFWLGLCCISSTGDDTHMGQNNRSQCKLLTPTSRRKRKPEFASPCYLDYSLPWGPIMMLLFLIKTESETWFRILRSLLWQYCSPWKIQQKWSINSIICSQSSYPVSM